jgi:plastocyanin
MRLALVTSGLAVALLAGGCGSGGGGASGTQASGPAGAKVSMRSIQFNPKTLTVKKGTTVEWVNDDSTEHDVTKDTGPGPQFSSGTGNLETGQTYKIKFDEAGTVKYECTVHPGMTGTIIVK